MAEFVAATKALSDVFAGQFDVDATSPGADFAVRRKEALDLAADVIEVAGLAACFAGDGIAMHRVAGPHHRMIGVFDRLEQGWKTLAHGVGSHTRDQGKAPRDLVGVERLA